MALTCDAIGAPAVVLEAVEELRPLGVGINLQPNAVRELGALGLERDLSSIGVQTKAYNMYAKHGGLIWSEPRGIGAGYKWPQFSVHRGELQMMLHRAVVDRLGPAAIRTSTPVIGFENTAEGVDVMVETSAGRTEVIRGSVLTAADGIHSAIRAQMYPDEGEALWSGRMLWRATTRAKPYLDGATMVLSGHEATKFVSYPISEPDSETGESTLNWIAQLSFDRSVGYNREDYTRQASVEDFLGAYEGWSFAWLDDLESLVRGAERIYEYPMVDRDPLPSWTDGHTTLIGDAAHVMYPVGSNGASQAIVDARKLGRALVDHGIGREALEAYEAEIRPATEKMILTNRSAGPDHIMQIVEERCAGMFDDITDVMAQSELEDFAAGYKKTAGLADRRAQCQPSGSRSRDVGDHPAMTGHGPGSRPDEPVVVARSAWLALGVTTLVFFLVVIDISAVNVAFPSIAEDLETSESSLSWIISGYNITVASFLLVAGRVADSWGRKRLFIPGIAVFLIGSILSGLAPSAGLLIAARVVQAFGGAIITPTALAVVLPDFPSAKRSMAIGLLGATGGLGAVVGPAVGSVLIEFWSWRGIFLINVPVCLIVLAISPKLLRESKNPNASGKIDLLGVPIGTIAICAVMLAIVESENWGLLDWRVLTLFAFGVALIPALIYRSARHPEPLIELNLYAHRSFSSANAAVAFYSLAFTSGFLVNSLLIQQLWDQPISTTGRALVIAPLVSAVAAPLSGRLADRIGHRWILTSGCLCSALGYLLFLVVLDETPMVFTFYVPISLLVGLGTGITIATWSSAGLSDVAPSQFGTANATLRTTQQVFYALGVSLAVTLLATGGGSGTITGFRWAWVMVACAYVGAAVVVAVTFPAGSSEDRRATGPSLTPTAPEDER